MTDKDNENSDDPAEHPDYELYRIYQEYFENHQKIAFDFWRQVFNNVWWHNNKDEK